MKYRTRMALTYAIIILLISLLMGVIIFRTSVRYEENTQRSGLEVSARSVCTQLEEKLDSMNAIVGYILSNPDILDAITLLSRTDSRNTIDPYVREARERIESGLSTEFIMENSYRTVFFNQDSYMASSACFNRERVGDFTMRDSRLIGSFRTEEIPYLPAGEVRSRLPLLIPGHEDFWGAYDKEPVFSLLKVINGEGMGYIEVEEQMSALEELNPPDKDCGFVILLDNHSLFYAGGAEAADVSGEKAESLLALEAEEPVSIGDDLVIRCPLKDYGLHILAFKDGEVFAGGRRRLFMTTALAVLVMYTVSLVVIIAWSNVLTRPIQNLQGIVEATNIGNLTEMQHMKTDSGQIDEFNELANAFKAMAERLNTALDNEKRSSLLQLQAQFDTLQTQVNPHFIYNVLNIISSRAVMDDDEVICEMCGCLANMLRYSTNNKARYASLKDELAYLHDYLFLLKARYESRLKVSVDVSGEMDKIVLPKMTLQQILENSVKHGFNNTGIDMEIEIRGRMLEDRWLLTVSDNGGGVLEQRLTEIRLRLADVRESFRGQEVPTEAEIGGMGLTNTYARCLLLFGEDLIFELNNKAQGAGFEVSIGCLSHEKQRTI